MWWPGERAVRLALARKRRMRKIYKWRTGAARTVNPANRDRGKLRAIAGYEALRLDPLTEEVLRPMMQNLAAEVARSMMQ